MSNQDQNARKLKPREWERVSGEWQNYLPEDELVDPEIEVEQLTSLLDVYDVGLKAKKGQPTNFEDVTGLRTALLVDAIAQQRRSVCALLAGLASVEDGHRSWARASCYQAAFYGMRAVCSILGCTVVRDRRNDTYYQLDVWAAEAKRSRRTAVESEFQISCHRRTPPRHLDWWSLLVRLVHCTQVSDSVWPYAAKDQFKAIESAKLPVQRNWIYYRSSYWPFDDLRQRRAGEVVADSLASVRSGDAWEEGDGLHDSVCLSFQAVGMGLALLKDLGSHSKGISDVHAELLGRVNGSIEVGQAVLK